MTETKVSVWVSVSAEILNNPYLALFLRTLAYVGLKKFVHDTTFFTWGTKSPDELKST